MDEYKEHSMMEQNKETIRCPFCGEEILAVAKKCKHCGEWIEEKNTVEEKPSQKDSTELQNSVRGAVEEAKWNEENSELLAGQALIIAIALGIIFESWWIGLGTFFGLCILLSIPYVGTIVCILLSGFYAYIGYQAGSYFFSDEAGWVIAIVAGLGSLGINLSGMKWFKDF